MANCAQRLESHPLAGDNPSQWGVFMSCPGIEALEQYVDGALEEPARREVDAHVSSCPGCRERVAEVQQNMHLADRVVAADACPSGAATILAGSAAGPAAPVLGTDATADPDATTLGGPRLPAAARELPKDSLPGYSILKEISRGGQGVVYQAIQRSTSRKVAIKVLRDGHFADAGDRARFEREVQILGQLKHANIVSIYDSGSVGGHAFFVMDYVSGKALDEWAADLKSQVSDLKSQGSERDPKAWLRRLLEVFAGVCDAVHAAHLRGIIHRDLKPSNIRIDADGQPRVLDFGLAKVAGVAAGTGIPSGSPAGTGLRSGSDHPAVMTLTGQFLGSLPWSSPEQAEGQPSKIDIRTDVYSLGVVLYEILTGRFPYDVTGNMRDVLDRILRAEPPRPSAMVWHGRPARVWLNDELDTIVLKCLAKERERRYQSAGELGRDIRHYLAGEAIEAKRDSTAYMLRKLVHRHRASAATAAGFLLLIGVSTLGLAVLYQRQSRETARAEAALTKADQRQKETQQVVDFQASQLRGIDAPGMGVRMRTLLLDEAAAVMRRVGLNEAEMNSQRASFEKLLSGMNLTNVALKQLDQEIFERTTKDIERQFASDTSVRAQLLQVLADTLRELGLLERAISAQQRALETRRRVLGDDHPDSLFSLENLGDLLLIQGKLAEAALYLGDALERCRRVLGDEHPYTLTAMHNMGFLLHSRGKLAESEPYFREALENRRRVLGDEHPHTLSSINAMGRLLQDQGKLDQAEKCYREAMELRRRVLGDEHPLTLNSVNWLGSVLLDQGKLAEAERYCRQALEARRRILGDENTYTLQSIYNMGNLFDRWDKPVEAERYLREVLATERRVLGSDHRDTIESMHGLGVVLRLQGKLAEAESYCREAHERSRRVLGDDHFVTHVSIHSMGILLRLQGKPAEAIALLAPAEPAVRQEFTAGKERRLGTFLTALGRARAAVGDFDAAERNLIEAHGILTAAENAFPRDRIDAVTGLAESYDAWHASEPGHRYDEKAAEWRAKLEALIAASQPVRESGAGAPP